MNCALPGCTRYPGVLIHTGSGIYMHRACVIEQDRRSEASEVADWAIDRTRMESEGALRQQPPKRRPMLTDGMTVKERAVALGVPLGTLYRRLSRERRVAA